MKGHKVIKSTMLHHTFRYQRGLNRDHKTFNDHGSCVPGGLYFFTDLKDLPIWMGFGDYLWEVRVPERAKCVEDPKGDKFRASELLLEVKHDLNKFYFWQEYLEKVKLPDWKASIILDHFYKKESEIIFEVLCEKGVKPSLALAKKLLQNGEHDLLQKATGLTYQPWMEEVLTVDSYFKDCWPASLLRSGQEKLLIFLLRTSHIIFIPSDWILALEAGMVELVTLQLGEKRAKKLFKIYDGSYSSKMSVTEKLLTWEYD